MESNEHRYCDQQTMIVKYKLYINISKIQIYKTKEISYDKNGFF